MVLNDTELIFSSCLLIIFFLPRAIFFLFKKKGLVSFADGLSTDPLGHKAAYLNNLIQNHGLLVHTCYGSSKDISVYTSLGLKPKQIFIVGKVRIYFWNLNKDLIFLAI